MFKSTVAHDHVTSYGLVPSVTHPSAGPSPRALLWFLRAFVVKKTLLRPIPQQTQHAPQRLRRAPQELIAHREHAQILGAHAQLVDASYGNVERSAPVG